jgi:p-aminobenzoyl-glutamate transporter AbgT
MSEIPDSPQELLRQHAESKKECQCLFCKIRRLVEDEGDDLPAQASLQIATAFLMMTADKMQSAVADAMKARVMHYALATANLHGQVSLAIEITKSVDHKVDKMKEMFGIDD